MRADRLVATLLLMQARGRVTAAEVATELEVSVATARRDLEALSAAGVPLYPQRGRGGGWSLVGGARTDLTGLTSSEATALFLLIGSPATASPDARSALRKIVRALPETFRADAEAASEAVVFDPYSWGERERSRPELVDDLQDAVVRRLKVWLTYENSRQQSSVRLVDPWGLVDKSGVWYLLAGTEQGRRTFRVDRITEGTTTKLVAGRPVDLELSDLWDGVVQQMEQRRSLLSATVLIAADLMPILRAQFGRHCHPLDTLEDGRVRVRVAAHMPRSIAETIAGWGAAGRSHRARLCQGRTRPARGRTHRALRAEVTWPAVGTVSRHDTAQTMSLVKNPMSRWPAQLRSPSERRDERSPRL